ncbi:hypothetical protein J6590_038525 [Homalodisca vitripennis]|nr:hypothetical protein J6590_038525 [Homalodisca vitripennis]
MVTSQSFTFSVRHRPADGNGAQPGCNTAQGWRPRGSWLSSTAVAVAVDLLSMCGGLGMCVDYWPRPWPRQIR